MKYIVPGMLILAMALGAAAQPPASKPAMQLKVDHATICVAELGPMQQAFADAGLKTDYGGPHASITHMAMLGFEDGSYLELIAPLKKGAVEGSAWAKPMAASAGPCAWAIASNDIRKDIAWIKSQGIQAAGPTAGGRKKPDGTMLRWETAAVGPGSNGSLLPFMIEDKTPRSLRVQPSSSIKDTGLSGIAAVMIAVRDLEGSIALFRKAYEWAEPKREDHPELGAKTAYFEGSPVILVSPVAAESSSISKGRTWLPNRLADFDVGPMAILLSTSAPDQTRSSFKLDYGQTWFGMKVSWFDEDKLHGVRLGVIQK